MDPYLILVAILGLCTGSFLNVLITRLPDPDRTLFRPAFSACPRCGTPIRARDNIPVLSWLILLGRCRGCKDPISILYPAVELTVAGIALCSYLFLGGWTWDALASASFLTLLLAVAVTDARTFLIPDLYTIGGAALGITLSAIAAASWHVGLMRLADGVLIAIILWSLGRLVGHFAGKPALGDGDVTLVAMMATFLGFGSTVLAIYLASISGVMGYVVHRRMHPKKLIPFGLHLAVGGALALLLGDNGYSQMLQAFLPWY